MEIVQTTTVKLMNGRCKAIVELPNGETIVIEQDDKEEIEILYPYGIKNVNSYHIY